MKANETNVHQLLQGEKLFLVPSFQRRYTWRLPEWLELWDDLELEMSAARSRDQQQLEGHFLGSIVLHPASGAASTLMKHVVVDGQQRLTTILVLLAAIRDVAQSRGESWEWDSITRRYMTNQFTNSDPHRLVPTRFDRTDFINTVIESQPTGAIGQAYDFFLRRLKACGDPSLEARHKALILHMILVEINTAPGDSVNTIFNTINSKGTPLSATDLIRNELLLHAGEQVSETLHEKYWVPIESALVGDRGVRGFDESKLLNFFWSRQVIEKPGVTKKSLFPAFEQSLRERLASVRTQDRTPVVENEFRLIDEDFQAYLEVIGESPENSKTPRSVRAVLEQLNAWGSETYLPLALWVIRALRRQSIRHDEADRILRTLLGFLVRRALAGVPTNNLNRMLTPLANQVENGTNAPLQTVVRSLSRRGSYWPKDREIIDQAETRPIYHSIKRHQVKFILALFDSTLEPRERVSGDNTEIEHVMPQSMGPAWRRYLEERGFSDEQAEPVLHTLGNLTLTSYNERLGADLFDVKRELLANSGYAMNRSISIEDSWTPDVIRRRSVNMCQALCRILPGPDRLMETDTPDRESMVREELETVLQSLDVGAWTSVAALVELVGITETNLRDVLLTLPNSLLRLVRTEGFEALEWPDDFRRAELLAQPIDDLSPSRHLHAEGLAALRDLSDATDMARSS